MPTNSTARWAEENWSDLRKHCLLKLRTSFPHAHRTGEVEDLFSEWLVDFISSDALNDRLSSGQGVSSRHVAHFCVQKSIARARTYGTDAHMRARGYLTETDRRKGIHSKNAEGCVDRCVDDGGEVHYVDPQSTLARLENRDHLRRLAETTVARYETRPQFVRCLYYLAEGLKRREMDEREGQSTNSTVTRLRASLSCSEFKVAA